MTDNDKITDVELDEILASATLNTKDVPSDLFQRIMSDAEGVLAQQAASNTNSLQVPKVGFLQSILAALGGWPAMASLASVVGVGVWLGFSPPASVADFTDTYFVGTSYYDIGDFMPSFVGMLDEG